MSLFTPMSLNDLCISRMETRDSSVSAMEDVTREPPTPQPIEEQIQQCLRMLEGTSDEHKFAGLLMITKLSGVDDERMRRVRRQVVDIVGVSFFLRLISTRGDREDSLSSFQVLGLNLIASFCEDASVAALFAQEKLILFTLDHLALLASPPTPSIHDCVSILQGVVQTEEGNNLLSQEKLVGRVVSTLKKMLRGAATPTTGEDGAKTETDAVLDAVVMSYWSIVEALSAHPPFWSGLASYDFDYLCSAFSQARGRVTTGILAIFNNLLQLIAEASAPAELLSSRALSDLRVGVVRFLRCKWSGHERDECLRLVYQLTRHSGFTWMLPGTTLRSQETEDEVSGGKFVLFVLKLVGIEIKVMLDEVELALLQMEEKAVERVDEEERQAGEVKRAMAVLPICYGLVESVIAGLVSSADGTGVLPYDILIKLKQSFSDTFTVIIEHLTAARDFMKTHRYKGLLANQSPTVYQLDAIVFASVRVISAWLAEDSDTGAEQAVDLLPFLVCYKPLSQHGFVPSSEMGGALDSDDEEIDSDDEVDAVGEMLRTATRIQEDDAQIDQLHFLLPGLLQISATPEGAQVIAEDVDVLRRILRFCCTLCANISTGEEQFGGIPTLSLSLGILLNLLLLRSSSVAVTTSGRAASALPNAVEWYRALSFLLPVACASGTHLMTETTLTEEDRGEDDRYVMVLHIACVILLIGGNFQDKKTARPCHLSPAVVKLVTPFNNTLDWMVSHPPHESSESATDLLELCRGLMLRSPLTQQLVQ